MAAYMRARELDNKQDVYGLGCTAALATNRQRKGSDRCFIAVQSGQSTLAVSLELDASLNRSGQELQCQEKILQVMAYAIGLTAQLEGKHSTFRHEIAPQSWQRLMRGENQSTFDETDQPRLLFPGAFNPHHEGHQQMTRLAENMTGQSVTLEISTYNVDKMPLDFIDMSDRQQSLGDMALVFTNAPTFEDKSKLYPGATFVVGVDTITRIADPKYYGHSEALRDEAIASLVKNRHRFLVFGRRISETYQTLKSVNLPRRLLEICDEVPESDFRNDISSSALRGKVTGRG